MKLLSPRPKYSFLFKHIWFVLIALVFVISAIGFPLYNVSVATNDGETKDVWVANSSGGFIYTIKGDGALSPTSSVDDRNTKMYRVAYNLPSIKEEQGGLYSVDISRALLGHESLPVGVIPLDDRNGAVSTIEIAGDAPIIPVDNIEIAIPEGKEVENIVIHPAHSISLPGEYTLQYAEALAKLQGLEESTIISNPELYGSEDLFPSVPAGKVQSITNNKDRVLSVALYPVNYAQAGIISYHPFIDIQVRFRDIPVIRIYNNKEADKLSKVDAELKEETTLITNTKLNSNPSEVTSTDVKPSANLNAVECSDTQICSINASKATPPPDDKEVKYAWQESETSSRKKPQKILEIGFSYDANAEHQLAIGQVQIKNGFAPKYFDGQLMLEIFDKDDKMIHNAPFDIPNKYNGPPPLPGDPTPSRVVLDKVNFLLTVDWMPTATKVQVVDSEGVILDSKDIADIPYINNQARYKSLLGSELLRQVGNVSPVETQTKYEEGGNPNKVEIAIIGDGYTNSTMTSFHSTVNTMIANLLTYEPFKSRASQIEFVQVENTADLKCEHLTGDMERCIVCDDDIVLRQLNNAGAHYEKVMVLNNASEYGGCASSSIAYIEANHYWSKEIFVHELGHTFTLWDEYVYNESDSGQITGEAMQNCYAGVTTPAHDTEWAGADYYKGCTYPNYYRSSYSSIMIELTSKYFNDVSQAYINKNIDLYAAPLTYYALSISKSGSGIVSSDPSGISCGTTCSASYASGTTVTLTASPASGYTFASWSGACSGTSICTVTMSAAKTVTATFSASSQDYELTISKTGAGQGTVSSDPSGISCGTTCSASYASGTTITLTASPASGYTFAGWSGACSGSSLTCAVSMTAAKNVTATFSASSQDYELTVSKTGQGTVSSDPSGINCGTTCNAWYPSETSVILTASPESGYTFAGWGGACSGSSLTCTVSMTAAKNVTVAFSSSSQDYELTVSKTGHGTVSSDPSGISCGTTCSASYAYETTVTLTASPASGYTFAGWGGACSGSDLICTVPMTEAVNVTAKFTSEVQDFTLSVLRTGKGDGAVTSSPSGISCGETCYYVYGPDTSVTLTATPVSGSAFIGWIGADCTGTEPCTVLMTETKSVKAVFENKLYPLKLTAVGPGKITSSYSGITKSQCGSACEGGTDSDMWYLPGEMTIKAVLENKYAKFSGWRGACSGKTTTCDITIGTEAKSVTAKFIQQWKLKVSKSGETSLGTIKSSPRGISCDKKCKKSVSYMYDDKKSVKLIATPVTGGVFMGWSGAGCTGTSRICTVPMTSARSVKAVFAKKRN